MARTGALENYLAFMQRYTDRLQRLEAKVFGEAP
jgi:hypothetical protein